MKKLAFLILIFCAVESAAQNFDISHNLKRHVDFLCSERLEGRKAGTEGEKAAAGYLYDALNKSGVIMLTGKSGQDFKINTPDGDIPSLNVVGIVEGSDPELREEYIVVGAHFDHLGVNRLEIDGKEAVQLYPGADDNASGVAMLIELARLVSEFRFMFPRSIIFVGFGAGEMGMAGSWYFVNRAFDQISQVKAMVNLDMLGRGNENNPFQAFSQMAPADYNHLLNLTKQDPVAVAPNFISKEVPSSDHLPFYEKKIPIVLFTTGATREYHSIKDLPGYILYGNMERECNYIFYFLRNLASQDEMPVIGGASQPESSISSKTDDKVYSTGECDVRPEFFHSNEKHFLSSWVYKYLKYPHSAIVNNIQGKVIVSFIIEKDGSVSNVTVESGVDELLDDEAVKVVSVSPKWSPGQIKGHKVRTRIVIPVEFRLK